MKSKNIEFPELINKISKRLLLLLVFIFSSSGIYVYRMLIGNQAELSKQMVVVK